MKRGVIFLPTQTIPQLLSVATSPDYTFLQEKLKSGLQSQESPVRIEISSEELEYLLDILEDGEVRQQLLTSYQQL